MVAPTPCQAPPHRLTRGANRMLTYIPAGPRNCDYSGLPPTWLPADPDTTSLTGSATGLGGKASNEEITVFCNGDSIIWFTACGGEGFASLQPASNSINNTAGLGIRGPCGIIERQP